MPRDGLEWSRSGWIACVMALSAADAACGDADARVMDSGKHGREEAAADDARGDGADADMAMVMANAEDSGAVDASLADRDGGEADPARGACAPRELAGDGQMHFHHVHFNTLDPEADLAYFEDFLLDPAVDFCESSDGSRPPTRATKTARAWFLYTKVERAPDPTLNTYLEHVGYVHPDPTAELKRLADLGAMFYPEGRAQCPEAATGTMPCILPSYPSLGPYYFYLQAPSGARVEVALGPGPAESGFGHIHFFMGEDLAFFATVAGDAFVPASGLQSGHLDMVNHIDASLREEVLLESGEVVETRGKPIDHIAYSTTDLPAARERITAAGIEIAEETSFKPEYGFRSFFVKSDKGSWVEIVEDAPFAP